MPTTIIINEDNEEIEVVGTRAEIDARLIEEDCGGFDSPAEFYEANNIYFRAVKQSPPEPLTVDELINRWI